MNTGSWELEQSEWMRQEMRSVGDQVRSVPGELECHGVFWGLLSPVISTWLFFGGFKVGEEGRKQKAWGTARMMPFYIAPFSHGAMLQI